MSSLFGKVADEIIDAHEQVYNQVMKGASILLGNDDGAAEPNVAGGDTSDGGGAPLEIDGEEITIEDMEDMRSPLAGIAESVMGDILEGQVGPQTPWEHVDAFRSAINWSEPFIRGLLAFQALVFVATIIVCKRESAAPRFLFLVFISIVVKSAEYINSYGAENWEDFATQNYFDNRGVFVGIMLCAPLLLNSFIMLISFIREASGLLIEVKKMEIAQKKRKEAKSLEKAGKKETTSKKSGKED